MRQATTFLLALSFCLNLSAQRSSTVEPFTASTSGWQIENINISRPLTNVPDCSPPESPRIVDAGKTAFTIQWDGIAAEPGVAYYVVRYRIADSGNPWTEESVTKGNSLEVRGLTKEQTHEVAVRKVCFWSDGSKIYSEWVEAGTATAAKITLPTHTCAQQFTYTNAGCWPALDSTTQVDTLWIGGFPIDVETNTYFWDGDILLWSGTGIVPLPFGQDKSVRVEWTNVQINAARKICYGKVTGISDAPQFQPNLNPGPIPFGGEICVKPPSTPGFDANGIHSVTGLPWDENGFGPDGKYVKQPPYAGYHAGAPYDTTHTYNPNGFDVNGINAITHTKYNPAGCDANGLDSLKQPCNPNIPPYSWMNPDTPNQPTQEGLEFADQVKDSLAVFITAILNDLKADYEDKITSKRDSCQDIRYEMEDLLTQTSLNRDFIFGAGDKYFEEGMHLNFAAKPELLKQVGVTRSVHVKNLESRHIDLYQCDKRLYVYLHFKTIILDFLGAGLNDLKADILSRIERLPKAQIAQFLTHPTAFEQWLQGQVKGAVDDEYAQQYGTIGFELPSAPEVSPSILPASGRPGGELLAAGEIDRETGHLLLAQALHARPEDIAFQYLQGFKEIEGFHRAYYMEAIVNARHAAAPFTEHDSLLMPIDITKRGSDGKKYTVYLDNIEFQTDKAILDAYILIELPFGGHTLVFEALDVSFTPYGPLVSPIKIQLGNDIQVRLNNSARMKLKAGNKTYVAFDCTGFAGIAIDADVELCRDVVLPYNPTTDSIIAEPRRVTGHFETYLPSFSEFYVEFSMTPFVIPGYEDVKWMIGKVALDMSETVSPSGTPPPGYQTPFAGPGGFRPTWKGFFIDSLIVRLPRQFSKDNNPIQVGIQHLVIDNQGVSGSVTVDNILSLNEGNAGGWAFSIKHFQLTVLMNQFSSAKFNGDIHVPIFRGAANPDSTLSVQDCFPYSAEISPGNNYRFAILPFNSQYAVDIWKAGTVTLKPESSIEIEYKAGAFKTLATLSGTAKVNGNLFSGVNVDIPDIDFEGVEISNQAPYFSPGTWKFPNTLGAKFAGFEITLSGLGMMETFDKDPALKFSAHIHVTDDTTKISASGGFLFVGRLRNDNGHQRWMLKKVEVEQLHLSGQLPGVHVDGLANFYKNDSIYGTGFRGVISANFEKLDASIQVLGQFGRMPAGKKYFFVDAMFCGTIPMAGALDIKGLGGGVYYRMTRPTTAFGLPPCIGDNPPIPTKIGTSLSGIVYTPEAGKDLVGFKITVAVALSSSERAFNANATFEALFNGNGSINRLWLYGNAKFMDDLSLSGLPNVNKGAPPPNNAAISANLNLDFTFGATPVLSGQLEVYANVAGVLRGADTGGKVVDATVRFAKGDWYIKVGSPKQIGSNAPGHYAGMIFTLPGFGELSRSESYFQIGNKVDNIPALPSEITKLIGGNSLQQNQRDNLVSTGKGFCFGTHLQLGNKNYKFLIFYAGLSLQMGFDISMLNYGTGAVCEGQATPVGINGWYAKGQIYAGIEGNIGIRVKVFGAKRNYDVFKLAAAAALQAQLPNPFWAKASVGFSYNILNGLVKGSSNFDFEIGHQCKIAGEDPAKDVPLINYTTPGKGAKNIPVSLSPKVYFNFPVGQSFSFEALSGNSIQYKLVLDSARLMWHGYEISCTRQWGFDNRSLTLVPSIFLPGQDSLTLRIKVHVDSSHVIVDNEERIVGFRTGVGLSTISAENVAGSYPFDRQYNFYKNELADGRGYVQLKRGQPDVFIENEDYVKVVRFRRPGGDCAWRQVNLNSEDIWEKKIEFDLPTSFLQNDKIYEMQLLDYPRADPNWGNALTGAAPCLCISCTTPLPPAPPGNGQSYPVEGGDTPIPPSPTGPVEKVIYTAYFRVSQYNTFMDKLVDLQAKQSTGAKKGKEGTQGKPDDVNENDWAFYVKTNIEPFDFFEATQGLMNMGTPYNLQTDPDLGDPWIKGIPPSWWSATVFPGAYQSALGLAYVPPFDHNEAQHGIRIVGGGTGSGSYLPFVTEKDYRSGHVANAPTVSQKLYFYAPLVFKHHLDKVEEVINAYVANPANSQRIREVLGCPSNQYIGQCLCNHIPAYTPPYFDDFKRIAGSCGSNSGNQADLLYPIQFIYQLPGTTQKTTDFMINLVK